MSERMNEDEIMILIRMAQSVANSMGLNPSTASPADIEQAAARQAQTIEMARKTVTAFEQLGTTEKVTDIFMATKRCAALIVSLGETLKA
jgi:hypothetical protein